MRMKRRVHKGIWDTSTSPTLFKLLNRTLKQFFFLNVYLFLRESEWDRGRDRGREGGRERERERERISSKLHEVSAEPDMGLELTNREIMTWAEIKSHMLNQLSHPGTPKAVLFQAVFLVMRNYS